MTLTIEQFPEFISIKVEKEDIFDNRVMIVKPGEYFSYNDLKLSYSELRYGPRIINFKKE